MRTLLCALPLLLCGISASAQGWRADTVFVNDGSFYFGTITRIIPDQAVHIRSVKNEYVVEVKDIRRIAMDLRFEWVNVRKTGPDRMRVKRLLRRSRR